MRDRIFIRRMFLSALGACAICLCTTAGAAGVTFARPHAPQRSDGSAAHAQRGGGSERAGQLIEEGVAALNRGDEAAARAQFERALKTDPSNVLAHTYLGVLSDRAGNLAEAEHHFAAAAIAAPLLPSARNNHGAILLRMGRDRQAAAQFEVSLKLDKNQPSALVNLAHIHFNSGTPQDLRAARALFERAQSLAPDAEVARALVVVALRLGEPEKAATGYRDYLARFDAAAPAEAFAAPARAQLGAALLESGLVEEAIKELSAAVSADPTNVDAVVALSRAYLRRKDIPAAGRTLEGAVARGIDSAPVYAALADVYDAGGYVENAIPAMRLAVLRDPANENYHLRYGMLLTYNKAPAAAVIRLKEAVAEFPQSPRLWLALGIAQLTDTKNSDAQKSFERSLELDPKSVATLAYLGTAYAERAQYEEAAAFFERAIAADGNQAAPFYLAADVLLKRPEPDTARVEKYLARAIELDPTLASARLALAKLHIRAERWPQAALQLEQAVRLDPNFAEAHYQLGRVYTRLKRASEAQAELEIFKRLNKTNEQKDNERRELVRRLANVRF